MNIFAEKEEKRLKEEQEQGLKPEKKVSRDILRMV